jgi:DNA-binding Lrp family transcriptional regulator
MDRPLMARAKSAKTFWVLEKKQVLCLASPRRHDIIDKLAAIGPMSIRELAPLVGASPASLYHHVQQLLRAGLLVKAGARVVNRRREQIYATPAPRMRLMRALSDPANKAAMEKVGAALARQFQRDFNGGLKSGAARTGGPTRNHGFFRLVGAPGPDGMAKINKHLTEIAEILWASAGRKGELVAVGWMMAPMAKNGRGNGKARTARRT